MSEKIEVAPFLRWDIRDAIKETPVDKGGGIKEADAIRTTEQIMLKVTEFVNENYTPNDEIHSK